MTQSQFIRITIDEAYQVMVPHNSTNTLSAFYTLFDMMKSIDCVFRVDEKGPHFLMAVPDEGKITLPTHVHTVKPAGEK